MSFIINYLKFNLFFLFLLKSAIILPMEYHAVRLFADYSLSTKLNGLDLTLIEAARKSNNILALKSLNLYANINAQDNFGKTALIIACQNDNLELAEILINRNANIYLIDFEGRLAYDYAQLNENLNIINLLNRVIVRSNDQNIVPDMVSENNDIFGLEGDSESILARFLSYDLEHYTNSDNSQENNLENNILDDKDCGLNITQEVIQNILNNPVNLEFEVSSKIQKTVGEALDISNLYSSDLENEVEKKLDNYCNMSKEEKNIPNKKRREYKWNYKSCNSFYPSVSAEIKHIKKGRYKCDYMGCKKSYLRIGNLKIHQRLHTGQGVYMCNHKDCNRQFAALSHLKLHKKQVHISRFININKK